MRISSRALGTGAASRYRSEDQLASEATVSPQNSATGITSMKPVPMKSMVVAKFGPDEVASSMNVVRSARPGVPATANAASTTSGIAASTPPITIVRRRRSWRTTSTRNGSVRPGR